MRAGETWLRRARLSDAAAVFHSYASDPRAIRFLSWPLRRSVSEVEQWLAPRVSGWDEGGEYRWVLVEQPDGEAFGTVSLRRSDRGFDLGYALGTSWSGRGIATDVVSRLMGWIDTRFDETVVLACTDPDNIASRRVLEKCSFRLVRRDTAASSRPGLGNELRDSLIFERYAVPALRPRGGVCQ